MIVPESIAAKIKEVQEQQFPLQVVSVGHGKYAICVVSEPILPAETLVPSGAICFPPSETMITRLENAEAATSFIASHEVVPDSEVRNTIQSSFPVFAVGKGLHAAGAIGSEGQYTFHLTIARAGSPEEIIGVAEIDSLEIQSWSSALKNKQSDLKNETLLIKMMCSPLDIDAEHVEIDQSMIASFNAEEVCCAMFVGNSGEVLKMVVGAASKSVLSGELKAVEVFWPPEALLPLAIPYTHVATRQRIHKALMLPNRPIFTKEAALKIVRDIWSYCPTSQGLVVARHGASWEQHLVYRVHDNVSLGSRPLKIAGAKTATVRGGYDYYHYRIDGFADDGWGCAYRSLQSMLSWFQYAGFMKAPMPSLAEIQKILYNVDPDKMKRPNFVGSKDWIGSFEVMLVVQHFMPAVECMIQRMDSGAELEEDPTIKRLLLAHFERGGCPVMIGGDSYAHSIIGIDLNPRTGDVQYLILDPHYSSETTDVKTVVSKGWCGWKQAKKFFAPTKWYNLCIPKVTGDLS